MRKIFFTIAAFIALSCMAQAQPVKVDLALLLAIDISASVDQEEYRLQMTGLAAALRSDAVLEAIKSGPERKVAISVMQWSGTRTQTVVVPWTVIDSEETATQLGLVVLGTKRADPGGGTSLSAALAQGTKVLERAPPATRHVIDLSVDGINNIGPPLAEMRFQTLAAGITVNGLAIANEWPKLQDYLELDVIGGSGAFAVTAKSYDDFGAVMLRKLVREIQAPGSS